MGTPSDYPDFVLVGQAYPPPPLEIQMDEEYRVITRDRFEKDLTPENIAPFKWSRVTPEWFARDWPISDIRYSLLPG